jgi:transketolase
MPNAQLSTKVVFYYNGTSGEIRMGLPEQFDAPPGFQKIVCTSSYDAEAWSGRMRSWEEFKSRIEEEQRQMMDSHARSEMRSHMHHLMANAKNAATREFLARSLENSERRYQRVHGHERRESYLHSEGFEHGH